MYNGKGLLKSVTDSSGTIRYRYDEYNRLTEKTDARGHVLSYAYDSAGRLAGADSGKGATKYRYDAMDRLTRVISRDGKATVYAYDKNGNRSKVTYANGVTLTYTYDACQRLKAECVTDASGKLLAKYAYGLGKAGERLAVTETDADGKVTADYVRGDELVSIETGKDIHYYVQDGHGSVRFLTDQDGKVTDNYSYDAYGNLLIKEGDTQNDYLYTGEQYNANTGLYYLRARYMDPSTGTFITMDSYQGSLYDPVTLHKYLYANADPVMNTDPTGYFSLAEFSVADSVQSSLEAVHNINSLRNIMKWANAMCTIYDTATEIRNVVLGEASVEDMFISLFMGVGTGILVHGVCGSILGMVLKPVMAIFGLENQVDQIQEAIDSGNPVEIAVRFVQLFVTLYGVTDQCFTGETLVSTEDGLIPIEDIREGDYVWSEDTETGRISLKKVVSIHENETDVLVHLTTKSGTEIDTTEGHPFYVEGKGWIRAGNLENGAMFITQDGNTEEVVDIRIRKIDERIEVYNLEIEDGHTYFVTEKQLLVHNSCQRKPRQPRKDVDETIINNDKTTTYKKTLNGVQYTVTGRFPSSSVVQASLN